MRAKARKVVLQYLVW